MSDWTKDAACAGMPPDHWFPEGGEGNGDHAKAICRSCPVRARCYLEAVANNETYGIWGGVQFSRRQGRMTRADKSSSVRTPQTSGPGAAQTAPDLIRTCERGPDMRHDTTCAPASQEAGA